MNKKLIRRLSFRWDISKDFILKLAEAQFLAPQRHKFQHTPNRNYVSIIIVTYCLVIPCWNTQCNSYKHVTFLQP